MNNEPDLYKTCGRDTLKVVVSITALCREKFIPSKAFQVHSCLLYSLNAYFSNLKTRRPKERRIGNKESLTLTLN